MPIYRYKCKACGETFDVKEDRMNLNRTRECISIPFCSGVATRVISKSSFALKGKGWFKDGY